MGLNPFGTGQCLSTFYKACTRTPKKGCLNPFGTGQCLSTHEIEMEKLRQELVSIPLEQGNVFRRYH